MRTPDKIAQATYRGLERLKTENKKLNKTIEDLKEYFGNHPDEKILPSEVTLKINEFLMANVEL